MPKYIYTHESLSDLVDKVAGHPIFECVPPEISVHLTLRAEGLRRVVTRPQSGPTTDHRQRLAAAATLRSAALEHLLPCSYDEANDTAASGGNLVDSLAMCISALARLNAVNQWRVMRALNESGFPVMHDDATRSVARHLGLE